MYPRESQHCLSHHIPASIVSPDDINISQDEYELALNYLRSGDFDIRKGDLVVFDTISGYRNDGVSIFNGTDIIDLDCYENNDYGYLPSSFRVIEDGISINYWKPDYKNVNVNGITHNNVVWFDHRLVRDQCLKNLQYGTVNEGVNAIFTTFTYLNSIYRIIFDYTYIISSYDNPTVVMPKYQQNSIIDTARYFFEKDDLFAFNSEGVDPAFRECVNNNTIFVLLSD